MDSTFSHLNDMQRAAVFHTEGPLLILAGAGSGKTTVLVNRIANLIHSGAAKPWQILAITFTNKAANELKARIVRMLGSEGEAVWASTFHSMCVRILRKDIDRLGYEKSFNIFDRGDQTTLVKDCLKILNLNDSNYPPKMVISLISRAKDYLQTPEDFEKQHLGDYRMSQIAKIYCLYQKKLKEYSALDFDDIIIKTVELFQKHSDVLEQYKDKFKYIMVDEYQDTNHAQYRLVSLLASGCGNLCVVGDDDQSIYKFRGADIENILSFEDEHKDAKVIKLEQNYRSTQNILDAANNIIKNNEGRKGKNLWTAKGGGELITIHETPNEYDEGRYVADKIAVMHALDNVSYNSFAILYRTNAQSRVLEEMLIRSGIPYKVFGGTRFYDRKEIKDIVAYMRAAHNFDDDVSVKRIINVPKRGIGKTTVDNADDMANRFGISFFKMISSAKDVPELQKAAAKLSDFASFIADLRRKSDGMNVSTFVEYVMQNSGYMSMLNNEDKIEREARLENLGELLSVAKEYEKSAEEPTLGGFLENIALYSDIDDLDEVCDNVMLMTLHSAKGLEFPVVFMPGMEDGLFPGYNSIEDPEELEEERRLCYVGVTRAMQKLYIIHSQSRTQYGKTNYARKSRFIKEIPSELCESMPIAVAASFGTSGQKQTTNTDFGFKPMNYTPAALATEYSVGDIVFHKKFGRGFITRAVSVGSDQRLEIAFDDAGTKNLMAAYANLSKD